MSNPEEALFDSWQQGRKQGMSAGIRYEKERIIKLLEADGLNCDCDWCQISGDVPSQHHWRILGLIKGKNNDS